MRGTALDGLRQQSDVSTVTNLARFKRDKNSSQALHCGVGDGQLGTRAVLDTADEKQNFCLCLRMNPGPRFVQPVV